MDPLYELGLEPLLSSNEMAALFNNLSYELFPPSEDGDLFPKLPAVQVPTNQTSLPFDAPLIDKSRNNLESFYPPCLPSAPSISMKTLASIMADSYITDSTLECISTQETLRVLSHFSAFLPSTVIKDIDTLKKDNEEKYSLEKFSTILSERVKNEKRAIFEAGFCSTKTQDPGHLVLIEVDAMDQSIRIYNQGAGIKYHIKSLHGRKERYGSYYEKVNIPLWILESPTFFYTLLTPHYFMPETSSDAWKADALYEYVKNVLPGDERVPTNLISPQGAGTCGLKSFLSWLKTKLTENAYNLLIFKIKINSLVSYEKAQNKVGCSATEKLFLKEIAEKFLKSTEVQYQVQTIVESEYLTVRKYLLDLIDHLNTPSVRPDKTLPSHLNTFRWDISSPLKYDSFSSQGQNILPINNDLYDGCSSFYPKELVFEPCRDLSQVQGRLDELLKHLQILIKSDRKKDAIQILALALSKLPPLTSVDNKALWNKVDKESPKACVNLLFDIINLINTGTINKYEYGAIQNIARNWMAEYATCIATMLYNSKFPLGGWGIMIQIGVIENAFPQFVPSAASTLFADYSAYKIKINTKEKTGKLLPVFEITDFKKKRFTLNAKTIQLDRLMADLLGMDIKDQQVKEATIANWKNANFLADLCIFREDEANLNVVKKAVQCHILSHFGFTKDKLQQAQKTCKKDKQVNSCVFTFSSDFKFSCAIKSLAHSHYSLAYRNPSMRKDIAKTRTFNRMLLPTEWLEEIKKSDNVLLDSTQTIIESLLVSTDECTLDNKYVYTEYGINPLEIMLKGSESKSWLKSMEIEFNRIIKTRDALWKERVQNLLRITSCINLAVFRLADSFPNLIPITLSGLEVGDLQKLKDKSPWPIEALWFVASEKGSKELFFDALTHVTERIGNGELCEALHRRLWHEYKQVSSEFLKGLLDNDWILENPERGLYTKNDEYIDLSSCLKWQKGARPAVHPQHLSNVSGFKLIETLFPDREFSPVQGQEDLWQTEDALCRILCADSWAFSVRGDFLMKHYQVVVPHPDSYYNLDIVEDHSKESIRKYLSASFVEQIRDLFNEDGFECWINPDRTFALVVLSEKVLAISFARQLIQDAKTQKTYLFPSSLSVRIDENTTLELPKIRPFDEQELLLGNEGLELNILEGKLQFKVSQNGKLLSQEYPGFILVSTENCKEAEGLYCALLRDSHGNEVLLIPTLEEQTHSNELFEKPWEYTEDDILYVAKRKAVSIERPNYSKRNLFFGEPEALLCIVRGLLRKRNYELAKMYVDLLSKQGDWNTDDFQNFIYTPLPLEHEKATLLRLRLAIKDNYIPSALVDKYLNSFHLLPNRWLLSKEEEVKIEKHITPAERLIQHKMLLNGQGGCKPVFFSVPTDYKKPYNRKLRMCQFEFKKYDDVVLPYEGSTNGGNMSVQCVIDSCFSDRQKRLEYAHLVFFYELFKGKKTNSDITNAMACMKKLLEGDAACEKKLKKILPAKAPHAASYSRPQGPERIFEIAESVYAWTRTNKSTSEELFNKIRATLLPTERTSPSQDIAIPYTSRQKLSRAPLGRRMGSDLLESAREVEKRLANNKSEILKYENYWDPRRFISSKNGSEANASQVVQLLKEIDVDLPALKKEITTLIDIGSQPTKKPPEHEFTGDKQQSLNELRSELAFTEREIIRHLNPGNESLEPLTVEDAFNWLSTQDQGCKYENFAIACERYIHLKGWIDSLNENKTPLMYPPSLVKGPRWALAAFLWFYDMQPRSEQLANYIPFISAQGNFLAKLHTGAGKTSFYTKAIIGNNPITFNVVPKEVVGPHFAAIQADMTRLGSVCVKRFCCSRHDMSKDLEPSMDRQAYVTTFEDLGSLVLCLYESLLKEYHNKSNSKILDGNTDLEDKLSLLTKNACAIFDEIHHLVRGNHELSYARKCKKGIPDDRAGIAAFLYEELVACGVVVRGKIVPTDFTKETRRDLAEKLIDHFYSELKENQKATVRYYLTVERAEAVQGPNPLELFDAKVARSLQIARAHLELYLKFTLDKRLNVRYGHVENAVDARPYRGSYMPAGKNSSFALVDTLINFTLQMYIISGLTMSQVTELIVHLQSLDPDSADATFKKCLQKTAFADKSFCELALMDAETLEEVKTALGKSELAALEYAREIAFTQIILSQTKMRFTGASLSALFGHIYGFSATPTNYLGYALSLRQGHLDHASELETMMKLIDPACTELVFCDEITPENFANEENVFAAIDPHASMYGYTNKDVALSIVKGAREEIRRVAYFSVLDEKWYTIDREGKCEPMVEGSEERYDLFYYIDQGRSIASDLPIPKKGVAYVLPYEGMPYHALYQGAGRCRNWGVDGQKIKILVPKRLSKVLSSHKEVIRWSLTNGGKDLQSVLVSMHCDLMTEVLRSRFLQNLLDLREQKKLHREKRYTLVEDSLKLLEEEIDDNQFIEHASLKAPQTDRQFLNAHYSWCLTYYQKYLNSEDKATLKELLESCRSLLPENSTGFSESSLFLTAENDQEITVERNVELKEKNTNWEKIEVDVLFSSTTFREIILQDTHRYLKALTDWKFQQLNTIVGNKLFPENLLISKKALGFRLGEDTSLLTPEMLPEDNQPQYYRQLPDSCYLFRVSPKKIKVATKYILVSDKEADAIAVHMQRNKEEEYFTGSILSSNGRAIIHFGQDQLTEQETLETNAFAALTRIFLGSIRGESHQADLKAWLKQNPDRIQPLQDFMKLRLAHLKPGHPDHYQTIKSVLFPKEEE